MKKIFTSDECVPSFEGGIVATEIRKSLPAKPLYMYRKVINTKDIMDWAASQGFVSAVAEDELHVTVAYSKAPVDWFKIGENYWGDKYGHIVINPGGPRAVAEFGKGAIVLCFASEALFYRNQSLQEFHGASWDYDSYQPHITLTYNKGDLDLEKVEPYAGKIELGPEIFEDIKEDEPVRTDDVHVIAKVLDVDQEEGIVYGWAIVNSVDGEPYYDLNIDKKTKEFVPEHITEDAMHKAALEFALTPDRPGNDMHEGPDLGTYPFIMPLSDKVAKAFGIECSKRGLMVGFKPPADILQKYKDGEYTGFSIEGRRVNVSEEVIDG